MTETPIQKILVVDDDPIFLDAYAQKFEANGMSVVQAKSAAEALEKLRDGFAPDLIVFDVVMPDVDGYAFLETLNTERLVPCALRIALSAHVEESDITRAQKLGIDGYISKASTLPSETVETVLKIATETPTPRRA